MDLRERRSFVTVILRPRKLLGLTARLFGPGAQAERDRLRRRIDRLEDMVGFLMDALSVTRPDRLTFGDGRWYGLLRTLVTGIYEPMPMPDSFRPMADLIATPSVTFQGDQFFIPGASTEDMRFGTVFSLKAYPATTAPGIFDQFDLDFDSVVTHSFTPIEPFDALARIKRTVRQMGAADDSAASLRAQLIDAADDLASGRVSFGNHHASIVIFTRSEAELDEAAAQVRAAGQRAGCVTISVSQGDRLTIFVNRDLVF